MGGNMVRRLLKAGHQCVAFARTADSVKQVAAEGAIPATSLRDLVKKLPKPRVVWLMVPAAVVDNTLHELVGELEPGDILIDGGNSYYVDDIRRAKELATRGLHYVDVGTSGGVGARTWLLPDDRRRKAGHRSSRSDLQIACAGAR